MNALPSYFFGMAREKSEAGEFTVERAHRCCSINDRKRLFLALVRFVQPREIVESKKTPNAPLADQRSLI